MSGVMKVCAITGIMASMPMLMPMAYSRGGKTTVISLPEAATRPVLTAETGEFVVAGRPVCTT